MDEPGDTVRRALQAFAARDLETMSREMTDDVVWVTPGRSPIAGEFRGRAAVLRYLRLAIELTADTVSLDLVALLTGGRDHVAIVVDVAEERRGRSLRQRVVQLYQLRDGRIAERRIFLSDQAAWDEFWAA
jgi:ketosteroid isomerase-like protein